MPDEPKPDDQAIMSDPHHSRADMRMVETAIRRGWNVPGKVKRKVMKRVASIATNHKTDKRVAVTAASVLVNMDKADSMAKRADKEPSKTTIINQVGVNVDRPEQIRVVEDGDWYGNADRLPAESAETSGADPAESVPIQDGGVRATVGKNGAGSNGHA